MGEMKMNTLSVWNPFRDLDAIARHMERTMGSDPGAMHERLWSPAVDITETETAYTIKVELPEVEKSAVKVTVREGVLEVRGERKFETETKDAKVHRIERAYGSFSRSFQVPDDADGSAVKAEFKAGVLKVLLPKTTKALPTEVDITGE
jgi:HSP20 family protein